MAESELSKHCRRAYEARRRAVRKAQQPGERRSILDLSTEEYNAEFEADGIRFDPPPTRPENYNPPAPIQLTTARLRTKFASEFLNAEEPTIKSERRDSAAAL